MSLNGQGAHEAMHQRLGLSPQETLSRTHNISTGSMKHNPLLLFAALMLVFPSLAQAQQQRQDEDERLVQFSGLVLDGTTDELVPVPFTNVLVVGQGRGTYTNWDGFFSIVVERGDTIEFSAVGYKTVRYRIPDTLRDNRYSIVQLMTQDTINLPETVVFPWPSREHFRLEFLAMDVSSEMQERAMKNLTEESLARLRQTTAYDANENADFYLRQQARSYYYIGQQPPMNIFNPLAWKQFFDAWKRGDFKKKSR